MSAVLQYDANEANNKPINKIIIIHCYNITDAVANVNGSYLFIHKNRTKKYQEKRLNNIRHYIKHICSCQEDCIEDIMPAGVQPHKKCVLDYE